MIIYDYALSIYDLSAPNPHCLCFGTLEQVCKHFSSTSVVRVASRGHWRDTVGEGLLLWLLGLPLLLAQCLWRPGGAQSLL